MLDTQAVSNPEMMMMAPLILTIINLRIVVQEKKNINILSTKKNFPGKKQKNASICVKMSSGLSYY